MPEIGPGVLRLTHNLARHAPTDLERSIRVVGGYRWWIGGNGMEG
jgi:hypothetical protein